MSDAKSVEKATRDIETAINKDTTSKKLLQDVGNTAKTDGLLSDPKLSAAVTEKLVQDKYLPDLVLTKFGPDAVQQLKDAIDHPGGQQGDAPGEGESGVKRKGGLVTEVDYPDKTKVSFGYDANGKLTQVTDEQGTQWKKQPDGYFQNSAGSSAIFDVGKNGDLTTYYQGSEGTFQVTKHPDGSSVSSGGLLESNVTYTSADGSKKQKNSDGSAISFDKTGLPTEIDHADKSSIQLTYAAGENGQNGSSHKVIGYTTTDDSGRVKKYTLHSDGQFYGDDNVPSGFSKMTVDNAGNIIASGTDKTTTVFRVAGGSEIYDSKNNLESISYPHPHEGTESFAYDANNNVTKYIDTKGNEFHLDNGQWLDANNKPTSIQDVSTGQLGSNFDYVNIDYKDGTSIQKDSDGRIDGVNKNNQFHVTYLDGTQRTLLGDGKEMIQTTGGTEYEFDGGRPVWMSDGHGTVSFGYGSDGLPNQIDAKDNAYHMQDGHWVDKQGKAAPFTGVITPTNDGGPILFILPDGSYTTTLPGQTNGNVA